MGRVWVSNLSGRPWNLQGRTAGSQGSLDKSKLCQMAGRSVRQKTSESRKCSLKSVAFTVLWQTWKGVKGKKAWEEKKFCQIRSARGTTTQKRSTWQKKNSYGKESWWNVNTRKTIVKISGEIKTPEETVMKNHKVGEMNKCNQQWKDRKTIVKISDEMKTPEKIVMKNPKGFSEKKSKKNPGFFKLASKNFPKV